MWAPVESAPVYDRSVIGGNTAFTWEDLSATLGVDMFGQQPQATQSAEAPTPRDA